MSQCVCNGHIWYTQGRYYEPPPGFNLDPPSSAPGKQSVRMRNKPAGSKPRPKTMAHAPSASDSADGVLSPSQGKRGSTHNIAGGRSLIV